MKNTIASVLAILWLMGIVFSTNAQAVKWNDSSDKGFVFEITNKEAKKLLTKRNKEKLLNSLLYKQVDTFSVSKGWKNTPSQGHFLLVQIKQNKLHVGYQPVIPYSVFLFKEYGVFALQVTDNEGKIRSDAKVYLGSQQATLDTASMTYRIDGRWGSNQKYAAVTLDKLTTFFDVSRHDAPNWYGGEYNAPYKPAFYSYLLTDKNRYRPGETVRFKAYALTGGRRPLKKNLDVWICESGYYYSSAREKKVGTVSAYRPGCYASEFHLHDSLMLLLDKTYTIQLREGKYNVISRANFKYEDYQLFGNKLRVEIEQQQHYYPNSNSISISATDVNGLPLKDGKAEVTLLANRIIKAYQPIVSMPDTLYHTFVDLDPTEPTTVTIGSKLFKAADCSYIVNVKLRNAENELTEQNVGASYFYSRYAVDYATYNDTIAFTYSFQGKELSEELSLSVDGKPFHTAAMPYVVKFDQSVKSYRFKGEHVDRTIRVSQLDPKLKLEGGVEGDSLKLSLANPLKLNVSWYIYCGGTLMANGFGNELSYNEAVTDASQNHYAELFYSLGGVEQSYRKTYVIREQSLRVSIDLPERAYPGQELNALVKVSDASGKPAANVDLTAVGYNNMLDYYIPDLPYYGSESASRDQLASYSMKNKAFSYSIPLNYDKWRKLAGLDSMSYYQFIYPSQNANRMFSYTVPTPDSTTQFAPFVFSNGNPVLVHVVECNHEPVYFSWTEQPKQYAFYPTRKKNEIALRLADKVVVLDSISFEQGKKTIIAVDLDKLPPNTKVHKLSKRLTDTEKKRYAKYLAVFPRQYENRDDSYLKSDKQLYPLSYKETWNTILAGPIPEGKYTYGKSLLPSFMYTTYWHEGGYSYSYKENVVYKKPAEKQQLFPQFLEGYSSSSKGPQGINDFVFTEQSFKQYVDGYRASQVSKWHPSEVSINSQDKRIRILLPNEKAKSGVYTLVLQNMATGANIYPLQARKNKAYEHIDSEMYKLFVLYENKTYLSCDSVPLAPNAQTLIDLREAELNEPNANTEKLYQHIAGASNLLTAPARSAQAKYAIRQRQNITNYSVRGTVIAEDDKLPLPFVTITVKGADIVATTNEDGYFEIFLDHGGESTLVFSFVGMVTQEIPVAPGAILQVEMGAESMHLEETIVVAYGAQRVSDALEGAVAGIMIRGVAPSTAGEAHNFKAEIPKEPYEEAVAADENVAIYSELLSISRMRSNFSDVAFWEPRLFTDKKGESNFKLTLPDNITKWDAVVYAMNRKLQTGTGRAAIRSYKPLQAELHMPQFLTVGDLAYAVGKIVNHTTDTLINTVQTYTLRGDTVWAKPASFKRYIDVKLPIAAELADSLTASFSFKRDDGYFDGEERTISVVQQGTERADGKLMILETNQQQELTAAENETRYLSISASKLDVYLTEARNLVTYRYDCNEQLASKLIGLLNLKLYADYKGEKFRYNNRAERIIRRLLKNQNKEFLWSWWNESPSTSSWISSHVLRALKFAKDAGYTVALNTENLKRKYAYRQAMSDINVAVRDIDLYHALASWNVDIDYKPIVDSLEKLVDLKEEEKASNGYPHSLLTEKMLLTEIRQIKGIDYNPQRIQPYLRKGIHGEMYFDDGKTQNSWYYNQRSANLVAYRIASRDSSLMHIKEPLQLYILNDKSLSRWNTYHSSTALMSVMPDLIKQSAGVEKESEVKVNEKRVNEFPYDTELKAGELLNITNTGKLPVYVSDYVIIRTTTAVSSDGFDVETSIDTTVLEAGKPATLTVVVHVKQKGAEHVMVEVPIPASCGYYSKVGSWQNHEVHREHYKEKVVIFCDSLDVGKNTFQIQLLPRFTGKYILNPAKVELMYFPTINANNDMTTIEVK